MAWELELTPPILDELYVWIDSIPLSKPKKRIERDFSDGTLVAEVIRHYLPDLINMHNYTAGNSFHQKKINWGILNKKTFCRFQIDLPESIIIDLCNGKPGTVEIFLFNLKLKIDEEMESRQKIQEQQLSTPRQSLLSLNTASSINKMKPVFSQQTSRTSRSIGNLNEKWIPRLDYEELKQQCLQQQEEIEIFQAKMRRLEHAVQLKDIHINEISNNTKDNRRNRSNTIVPNRFK